MKKIKGGVTAPKGFAAMGLKAGIKKDKKDMASARGTIVQSILHYKNWSHSPLYAFRFSDI